MRYGLFIYLAGLALLAGCAPGIQETLSICPGQDSVAAALAVLQKHSDSMQPLAAKGRCKLILYDEGKKRTENLSVNLLVKSSMELYFQGDMTFANKAVILGSNNEQFWLAISPEISTYWSGSWDELNSTDNLFINPKTLLEAMGVAGIDMQADWSLSNEGPFDVLAQHIRGNVVKKYYIYCCDNSIRKIEYFDTASRVITTVELSGYKAVSEDFSVPGMITIARGDKNNKEDYINLTIELNSVNARQFTPRQDELFQPFPEKGFENIYRLINGRLIEESS